MKPSIFTKIINGEIPCHKIYEDEQTFAFLDIHPSMEGHTLVVPKQQVDYIDELDDQTRNALFATVQKLSKHLRTVYDASRTVQLVMGYDVPHAHVHLVPIDRSQDFYNSIARMQEEAAEPDHDQLAKTAEKIRKNLS